MKQRVIGSVLFLCVAALVFYFLVPRQKGQHQIESDYAEENEEGNENEAINHYMRWKYDADMIKDPTTGEVLDLRDKEIEFAKTIPERLTSSPFARVHTQNTYLPAGPNNQGGRTRAIVYDRRYNGTSNRVIMAGNISGGIFRSVDGGANWTLVTPANEVHNVACIAQSPTSPDTWYAGGGEYIGSSADALGAGYIAHGLLKSTNNGATWTRIPLTNITDQTGATIAPAPPFTEFLAERFDHPFDYVHKIAFNPVNGNLYVACHRRVLRSTDNGATFQTIFGSATTAVNANGQCDVTISQTGKVYVACTGAAPDLSLRGVWRSTSGDFGSFQRLAGGQTLGVDSVANWRANSYELLTTSFYDPRRILIALAPSNENFLYVVYENGLVNTSTDRNKEADLFKLDMTSGFNWTNLSNNLPDFPGGDHEATDPFTIQSGYDLVIAVKPDNPNFVLLGGTSLYRSTDGFATSTNTSWIGGYGNTLPTLTFYAGSHPDIHGITFNPQNFNEIICGNDGGIQKTFDITSPGSTVVWSNLSNYQTLQYYHITIDPETGVNNFAGGAQDNGTQFRDKSGITGNLITDSNNHKRLVGGDGGSVGISKKNGGGQQYLFGGVQFGSIRRGQLQGSFTNTEIRPNGLTAAFSGSTTEFGEFVTNFRLNPDNTDDLYYVNFNRLFRTTSSPTVTSSSWTELTGVGSAVNPASPTNGTNIGIRAMAFSRGNYGTSHAMYFGTTDGKVFRLDDPRNAAASTTPVNITPPTSVADISGYNVQDIAVNPNNDNEIIIVISNYGKTGTVGGQSVMIDAPSILWTNNAKAAAPAWKKAEGNLAGTNTSGYISARSAMIIVKKDGSGNAVTEYYVGTAAGLFAVENLGTTLSANGSPTWQREGSATLNFAVINSLAYRPADNVLAVGTHGNGLYYTFLGTPNLITGINNPILNDKDFITTVFPTINASVVQYRIGNKADVKKISVQLYNMQGRELYREETSYQNGSVSLNRFAKGAYILSIYSDNKKYRHIQKIVR
jgi:hypothetical protein